MARGHWGHGTYWCRVGYAIEHDKLTQRIAHQPRGVDQGSEIFEHPHMQHVGWSTDVNSNGTIRSGIHQAL